MDDKYADIIDLPHHTSPTRIRMSVKNRAAQFSPFAALTGYDDAVKETARLTDQWNGLSEDEKELLDRRLTAIMRQRRPAVRITFFEPDQKKTGGAYVSVTGVISKISDSSRRIILEDGTEIPVDMVCGIDRAGE